MQILIYMRWFNMIHQSDTKQMPAVTTSFYFIYWCYYVLFNVFFFFCNEYIIIYNLTYHDTLHIYISLYMPICQLDMLCQYPKQTHWTFVGPPSDRNGLSSRFWLPKPFAWWDVNALPWDCWSLSEARDPVNWFIQINSTNNRIRDIIYKTNMYCIKQAILDIKNIIYIRRDRGLNFRQWVIGYVTSYHSKQVPDSQFIAGTLCAACKETRELWSPCQASFGDTHIDFLVFFGVQEIAQFIEPQKKTLACILVWMRVWYDYNLFPAMEQIAISLRCFVG